MGFGSPLGGRKGAGPKMHDQKRHTGSLRWISATTFVNEVKADAKSKVITTLDLVSYLQWPQRQDGKVVRQDNGMITSWQVR